MKYGAGLGILISLMLIFNIVYAQEQEEKTIKIFQPKFHK